MKKITRHIIWISGLIALIFACKKFRDLRNDDDNRGESHIRGRLFLHDNLTKSEIVEAKGGKKVTIRYADIIDTVNYLFQEETGTDGYFTFNNLVSGKTYIITYEESVSNVLYRATARVQAPLDTLPLIATISEDRQNGFHIVVADSSKGTYPLLDICVFNGPQTFALKSCSQAVYKPKTDSFGRAYAFSIPPARYYFYSSLNINNQEYYISDSLDIAGTVIKDTFYLQKKASGNGIQYVVLDQAGSRVPGGDICVFTSAELYKRDTCEGSNFQIPVDEYGSASKFNIPPNTYYIFLKKVYGDGSIRYVARDTIVIGDKLKVDTLHLKPF